MTPLAVPELLQTRLDNLPKGLQNHIDRVRKIARDLAAVHGINQDLAELTAAAHDVARATNPKFLLEEARRMGFQVNTVEIDAPMLLHGSVGAGWLAKEGTVNESQVLEGIRWHTTCHPDLSPMGQVVFLADKLDPFKVSKFPFHDRVRDAALHDLDGAVLAFLEGSIERHIALGEIVHPVEAETRRAMIAAGVC